MYATSADWSFDTQPDFNNVSENIQPKLNKQVLCIGFTF